MAEIATVHYVLASSEDHARRLARAVHSGAIPPMARNRQELTDLRLLHPVAMIGSIIPFAVFTGLEKALPSRLVSGDWAAEVRSMFEQQERTHGQSAAT